MRTVCGSFRSTCGRGGCGSNLRRDLCRSAVREGLVGHTVSRILYYRQLSNRGVTSTLEELQVLTTHKIIRVTGRVTDRYLQVVSLLIV